MALITVNQLSDYTGKHRATIIRRLAAIKPIEKKGVANLFDSAKALEVIYQGGGQSSEELDLQKERARLAKAQADAQELKNKISEKETAPMVILEAALTNVCIQIKSVLESIPLKVKQRVPSLTSMEIEIIAKEIIKAQNAASDIRLDFSIES